MQLGPKTRKYTKIDQKKQKINETKEILWCAANSNANIIMSRLAKKNTQSKKQMTEREREKRRKCKAERKKYFVKRLHFQCTRCIETYEKK